MYDLRHSGLAPLRGLVYLQQCLIHHWKWNLASIGFPPQAPSSATRLPDSHSSDSSGTHLEAIWGSNPLLLPLFFSPPPSDPPPPPSRLLPFSAEGSFKGLGKALERQSQLDPGVVEPRGGTQERPLADAEKGEEYDGEKEGKRN
ncbi:hypothetical protein NQZ68_017882 [Dissostichus eleginoides]|nr:hypothetical protein NQZ68_017882 [Dissostichus eleginoides]